MSIKSFFSVRRQTSLGDIALLVMRAVVGIAFVMHGSGKIQNPFDWMGPDAFAPGIFQALAALSEFGGGIALILGLLTPLASLGLMSTMAVATYTHMILRGDPFTSTTGGPTYELAAVFFSIAFVLFAVGPGRFSLDRKLFG